MARPINEEARNENLASLEKAAKILAAESRPVTIATLADVFGCSRQYLHKTDYLREKAYALIQEYAKPKAAELSDEDWKGKYEKMYKAYQAKSRECERLKEQCESLRAQRDRLETDIKRVRGERYMYDLKNHI